MTSTRSILAALLFLTLTLAGCGGGDDATPPPAGSAITIAAGGTATITKATPPADVLADPGYVPDSAYVGGANFRITSGTLRLAE